jgi:hypothetical protein
MLAKKEQTTRTKESAIVDCHLSLLWDSPHDPLGVEDQ